MAEAQALAGHLPSVPPRLGALAGLFEPLARIEPPAAGQTLLAELAVPGQVDLRGDPADPRFATKVGAALGCVLPTAPNSVQTAEAVTVLWLGPDEWLILCEPGGEAAMVDALREALGDTPSSVVDVTGNRARLRLSGDHAREVLAKGCPLDLHPRVFRPGQCAQSLLARAQVILHMVDDRPSFDILPRRSFTPYVWAWLQDAAREYGGIVARPTSPLA